MKVPIPTLGKSEALAEKNGSLTARAYLFLANVATFCRGTKPYIAITAAYTVDNIDYLIHCTSGTYAVTLVSAVGIQGREYEIKNSGAGTITVTPFGSETIDGDTTKDLLQYDAMKIMSDGANWIII